MPMCTRTYYGQNVVEDNRSSKASSPLFPSFDHFWDVPYYQLSSFTFLDRTQLFNRSRIRLRRKLNGKSFFSDQSAVTIQPLCCCTTPANFYILCVVRGWGDDEMMISYVMMIMMKEKRRRRRRRRLQMLTKYRLYRRT